MKTLRLFASGLALTSIIFSAASAHAATSLLYIAGGFGPGKVTAIDPATNGAATPLITLNQPEEAFSVAFDPALRLYTQAYMGSAPIYIYPPNASGNATPVLTAYGIENDATGVAVDSKGYIYQITGSFAGGTRLNAFAPNTTTPYVSIPLNFISDGVAVDADDNVIVTAWARATSTEMLPPDVATAIEIFAPRLQGNAPIRIIAGANTGLTAPWNESYTGFKVTYSKLTGRIYAGLSGGSASKVLVFDSHADGNTAPLRTITGPATGLKTFIHGIASNPVTGELFVLSRNTPAAPAPKTAAITVYAQLADGNAAPLRTITGNFEESSDLAFTPPASSAINAGGAAVTPNFTADSNFTGGTAVTWTNTVDTSLLLGIVPPQAVLKSDREGNFTYKFTGFVPNSLHSITAYFVENYFTATNKRVFNVYANGAPVVVNLDVFAEAGARFKAIQRSASVPANASGEILIQTSASKDQAKIGAILVN